MDYILEQLLKELDGSRIDCGINGVSYTKKNNENITEPISGILSQNVEKIIPTTINTDRARFTTVTYNQLIGMLCEVAKELYQRVQNKN